MTPAPPRLQAQILLRGARSGAEGERDAAALALAVLAQAGAPRAVDAVVVLHLERVRAVARRLRVPTADAGHYESVGAEALVGRLRTFDPDRGVPLWGYARLRVRGEIIYALGASLGLTPHQTSAYRRVWQAYDAAVADDDDHRAPSADVVYRRLRLAYGAGIGVRTVEAVLALSGRRPVLLGDLPPGAQARALRSE